MGSIHKSRAKPSQAEPLDHLETAIEAGSMHWSLTIFILHVQGRAVLVEALDHLEMAPSAGSMHQGPADLIRRIGRNPAFAAKPTHFLEIGGPYRSKQLGDAAPLP